MTLLVGGAHQGKLPYALEKLGVTGAQVAYDPISAADKPIFAALETWLKGETDPLPALEGLLEKNPAVVILCDEVGCGVVPLDKQEREWRERVGRTCCYLAQRAQRVERLLCGIPMVLKGELTWN